MSCVHWRMYATPAEIIASTDSPMLHRFRTREVASRSPSDASSGATDGGGAAECEIPSTPQLEGRVERRPADGARHRYGEPLRYCFARFEFSSYWFEGLGGTGGP